jgi:TetR/AcrR family transcriptional regulator, tetracycline repressor protein
MQKYRACRIGVSFQELNNVLFPRRIGILAEMKINRDMVTRAGLKLLNEDGIEQLTLRRLGQELHVQAATIYWHFKSKEELLDEMASTVLAEGVGNLFPKRRSDEWKSWAEAFGKGLRKTLLAYRDGARMVSGTRLTNDEFVKATDTIGSRLMEEGFSLRGATILGTVIYNYTLSFVIEEQAVFPKPGQRNPHYEIEKRQARFNSAEFPFHSRTSTILFAQYDRRYREGLELILAGARPERTVKARQSKAVS